LTYSSEYLTQKKIDALFQVGQQKQHAPHTHILKAALILTRWLSRHKKIPRGGVMSAAHALLEPIRTDGDVVSARIYRIGNRSRLSTQEAALIHTISLMKLIDEDRTYLSFAAGQIRLTRTNLDFSLHPVDLWVKPHVVLRYVQREQKPVEEFRTGGLMAMIETALPISLAAAQLGVSTVAVPFGSGMCVGRIRLKRFDPGRDRLGYSFTRNRGMLDLPPRLPRTRDANDQPVLAILEARTFMDFDAMVGVREQVYAMLVDFQQRHRETLSSFHQDQTFGSFSLAPDDSPRQPAGEAMFADCLRLLSSPTWKEFSARAQEAAAEAGRR
jgi:hypothetical protein